MEASEEYREQRKMITIKETVKKEGADEQRFSTLKKGAIRITGHHLLELSVILIM